MNFLYNIRLIKLQSMYANSRKRFTISFPSVEGEWGRVASERIHTVLVTQFLNASNSAEQTPLEISSYDDATQAPYALACKEIVKKCL